MRFKGFFVFLLGAGVGSAVTYYICQRNKNTEIEELMEKEWGKRNETKAEEALEEYTEISDENEGLSDEEIIIKNAVLTESPEKPDLFDYAKISLAKKNDDPPAEKSHDPIEDEQKPTDFFLQVYQLLRFIGYERNQ